MESNQTKGVCQMLSQEEMLWIVRALVASPPSVSFFEEQWLEELEEHGLFDSDSLAVTQKAIDLVRALL
jgi:hypothetical protein